MDGTATLITPVEDVAAPPTPKPRRRPTTPRPQKAQRAPAPDAQKPSSKPSSAQVFDAESYETVPPWLMGREDDPRWSHFPEADPAAPEPQAKPEPEPVPVPRRRPARLACPP